jgi:hypothetical protein
MLTDWFPGKTKPVRFGIYQIKVYSEVFFSYFDGENWSWGYRSPFHVQPDQRRCSPPHKWRGVVTPTEGLHWIGCYG